MIGFKVSDIFVDSALVEAKIEKAKLSALKRVGFATRQDAMVSIKDGQGTSSPGSPPTSHTGALRRFILYSLNETKTGVVIGPKYLRKKSRDAAKATEHGGTAITTKGRPIRVAARPFMGPAFERVNRSMVPAVFANSIK